MIASDSHAVATLRRERAVLVGIVLGSAGLATLFFCPRYWLWCFAGAPLGDVVSIQPEFNRAYFILQQLHDPWQRIDNLSHRVIEWRLLFPVLGHYTGLSDSAYFGLAMLGVFPALGVVAWWLWRQTQDRARTAAGVVLSATASWYLVATGWLGYFDGWLIAALLAATFSSSRRVLLLVALLAPWVDERFLLAVPGCLAVRAILASEGSARFSWVGREVRWLALGLAPYVLARVIAEATGVRATSGMYFSDRTLFTAPPGALLLGLWHGFRCGWALVGVTALVGVRRRQWLALGALAASLAVNLAVADDLSRSTSILLPAAVAGAGLLVSWRHSRRWLVLLAAGNLILPAAHIIATPRSTMERYHRTPVLYLYAEREHAANPPEFASPAIYTARGIEALQAGRLDAARSQFDLALRYDPEFSRAWGNRGIARYAAGEKTAGLADLDRALVQAPELFDVRLQRASFREESGDLAGAVEDVRLSLRNMPADWPRRREAESYARQLEARAAAR